MHLFRLQRLLFQTGLLVATLAASLYAVQQSNYLMLGGLVALLFVPILIRSPIWLLILVMALYGANLSLPILPASMTLHTFLAAVLAGWLLVREIIQPTTPLKPPGCFRGSSRALGFYLGIILLIMLIRGSGMRVFGSEQWGGSKYFNLAIAAALFWTAPRQPLTERQWRFAFLALTVGYLLPFFALQILMLSGGRIDLTPYVQAIFSDFPDLEMADLQNALFRIQPLAFLGNALALAALVLIPVRFPHSLVAGGLIAVGAGMVGMAGYRSHFLILAGTVILFSFLHREHLPWGRNLLRLLLIGATLFLILLVVTPLLPPVMQRTLSVIPGLGISETVQQDAQGTVLWRVDLWKFSLSMARPYLWIGRGFLFSPEELPWFDVTIGHLHMFLRHSYHNGPIGLLIDTGIPGLIAGSLFLILAVLESRRQLGAIPAQTPFGRAYRALFVYLTVQAIYFYAVIGDPVASFIRFLFVFTLMKILLQSHQAAESSASESP